MRRELALLAVMIVSLAACGGDSTGSAAATTVEFDVSAGVWTRVPHDEAVFGGPGSQEMRSVVAVGSGLVAFGSDWFGGDEDAAVWTSPDGLTWTRVPHDEAVFGGPNSQKMLSVVAGGPGLVAVGYEVSGYDSVDYDSVAVVWTSPDGVTWTRVPHDEAVFGGTGSQAMNSVVAGGPGLVAVGNDVSADRWDAAVWTSPDGLSWTRVPHDEAVFGGTGSQRMNSVVAGGPGLVAVGLDSSGYDSAAVVWTSPDGLTWTRIPHNVAVFGGAGWQRMNSVVAGGPGLVAIGSDESGGDTDAAAWTSPDGLTWTRVPHDEAVFGGTGSQEMMSVVAGGPGLVAIGYEVSGYDSIAVVWTSPDGLTWTRVPHNEIFGGAGSHLLRSVAAVGSELVAVGYDESGGDRDAAVWRWAHDE
jgi:hypothetical protein